MAEYTGPNTSALLDGAVQTLIDVSNSGGRVRTVVDARSAATAWAENDTVLLARLPSNAVILPTSRIIHEAFGSSVTADVGIKNQTGKTDITNDPNALADGQDISSAGSFNVFAGVAVDLIGQPLWQIAGASADPGVEFDIYLSLVDANPTDDAAIGWCLQYVVD